MSEAVGNRKHEVLVVATSGAGGKNLWPPVCGFAITNSGDLMVFQDGRMLGTPLHTYAAGRWLEAWHDDDLAKIMTSSVNINANKRWREGWAEQERLDNDRKIDLSAK